MKYALIIPDGCADEPQDSLAGRTPLQAARTPAMDAIAAAGCTGLADHVPESLTPGSDVGTMSLFGYDPLTYHTGRASIEAAAQGIELGPDDWAVRCNIVSVEDGVMRSFTAGQIPNALAAELIAMLQKDLCGDEHWKFHTGVSYRNLLIYRSRDAGAPFTRETLTHPPHDITNQPVEAFLPTGPGSDQLRALMRRSEELFPQSEANLARQDAGEPLASGVWLWGLGWTPTLPPFQERFGIEAAVITAVDLLRGLARLLGMQQIDVPGATGYTDTDYAAKGQAAIDALARDVDLVVVHVEATDEASHEGDAGAKVEALERIDRDIVTPVHAWLREQGDYRVLISPDHPTLLRTRTHSHGFVPFAMCGRGIEPDDAETYDETTAAQQGRELAGHELMPALLLGS